MSPTVPDRRICLSIFDRMLMMRHFEEAVIRLYKEGRFVSHYHVYIGQEATGAAVLEALNDDDLVATTQFTVEENIRLPTWSTKMDGAAERLEWIFGIMPEVARFKDRRALELSGGQQKMVALARALMAGTHMLLLDEPFEGLAPALARRLGEVLANLKTEGVSVLIAESNEVHVLDLLARAYFIERGAVSDKR